VEEFKKLKAYAKEEVFNSLIRSKYTFSIVAPQPYKTVADSINGSHQNVPWYKDNNYPFIATQIIEYGISYCQYSYSLPRAITELIHLFMKVNYPDYFAALGYTKQLYDPATNRFDTRAITDEIKDIQTRWKDKFPKMDFKIQNLRFDSLVDFDLSFTREMELLNTEDK
jgi:hypothetical protein